MKWTNPFADPSRRPRAIIWSIVAIVVFAGVFVTSQLFTSSAWFCNDVCHNVHEDNANEWYQSSHEKISCIACHYPPNMSPVAFTLDRVDKLLDVWPTITGDYEWPMNLYSHLAAVTPDDQCLQCHADERIGRTSPGIIMDHAVHEEAGINCASCHNRVCHPEDEYQLRIPYNKKKQDWMSMPGCMRCHWLDEKTRPSEYIASGKCATCHTAEFDLTPETHTSEDWVSARGTAPSMHGESAKAALEYAETQEAIWMSGPEEEFKEKGPRLLARLAIGDEPLLVDAPPYWTIFDCWNCHTAKFCSDCHGVELPHTEGFATTHGAEYKESQALTCAKCHNTSDDPKYAGQTCSQCHHPQWTPSQGAWIKRHAPIAKEIDTEKECLTCHEERFCTSCHVNGKAATPY